MARKLSELASNCIADVGSTYYPGVEALFFVVTHLGSFFFFVHFFCLPFQMYHACMHA